MIRAATPDDAAAIVGLESDCLGDDAWAPALVDAALSSATTEVLVTGAPVHAYAVLSVAGDIADLQRIAVVTGRRRTGVATELLAAARAVGRRAGADRMLVEVRADNHQALDFYADAGFVEIDRRPRYYRDGADAVVLRLPLLKGCG